LGSIGETTIKEAWNSKRETTYRNFHIEGNSHIIDSCQLCSLRDTEIGKLV
jgi:hypothetical protein